MHTVMKRQPEGIPVGGQFAASVHAEPEIALRTPAAPSTLHTALDSTITEYERRIARLSVDDTGFPSEANPHVFDPGAAERADALAEGIRRIEVLRDAGLNEGELAAAARELGQELRSRGFADRDSPASTTYESIGNELILTAFDNRDPVALLERRAERIRARSGLSFEDETPPAGGGDRTGWVKYTTRLKLSGITGTVRHARVSGRDGDTFDASIECPDGRRFLLEMTHSNLRIEREDEDLLGDEFIDNATVEVDAGPGPLTAEMLGKALTESRRRSALTDAWMKSTAMRSTPAGSHPAVQFRDFSVHLDEDVEAAVVFAKNSIGSYRIERLRDPATGEAETRVQPVLTDEGKVPPRMTGAILADLSQAGGGAASGAAFERDLDKALEAAKADPAFHGR